MAAGWRRRLESNGRLRTEVGKEVPNLETTSYFLARGLFGARTVIARRAPVMDALSEAFLDHCLHCCFVVVCPHQRGPSAVLGRKPRARMKEPRERT